MPIPAAPTSSSTTTLSQWIEETRYHLDGPASTEANQLNGAYTAQSGTLTLQHAMGNVAAGAIITIGLNTLRVMSVTGQVATVIGGWNGSADASAATGALVRVNPRFSDFRIVRALNSHLGALSSPRTGLFRVLSEDITYAESIEGYELPDDEILRVLEVRRQTAGTSLKWPRVRADQWDLVRTAPAEDFPSGVALWVSEGTSAYQVQVVYAAPYDSISQLDALVSTTGISSTAEDIPPLGAAIRLMAGREVARNATTSQGDTRRPNEVPPGSVAASVRGLVGLWQERVLEENARLRSQYPVSG